MDHHAPSDHKNIPAIIIVVLALFFGLTVVGNHLFVASLHHESATQDDATTHH